MPSKFHALRRGKLKTKDDPKLPKGEAPVAEVSPITEEELNTLLADLNEEPAAEAAKPAVTTVEKEEAKVEKKRLPMAYNIFYDSSIKKYRQVTIEYDITTEYSKIVKVENIADSQPVALHKMNKLFALKIIKGEEKI